MKVRLRLSWRSCSTSSRVCAVGARRCPGSRAVAAVVAERAVALACAVRARPRSRRTADASGRGSPGSSARSPQCARSATPSVPAAARNSVPSVVIAGYTNAGKSSLLNRLTGARALVQDALFATLDPTTRRARTADGRVYTLSDTVGFVRHLPHQLVEAFRSTLEEVGDADLVCTSSTAATPIQRNRYGRYGGAHRGRCHYRRRAARGQQDRRGRRGDFARLKRHGRMRCSCRPVRALVWTYSGRPSKRCCHSRRSSSTCWCPMTEATLLHGSTNVAKCWGPSILGRAPSSGCVWISTSQPSSSHFLLVRRNFCYPRVVGA